MPPASGSPNPLRFPHIFHALPASCHPRPAWPLIYAFWLLKNEVLIFVGSNPTCLASAKAPAIAGGSLPRSLAMKNPLSPSAHPIARRLASALPLAAQAAQPDVIRIAVPDLSAGSKPSAGGVVDVLRDQQLLEKEFAKDGIPYRLALLQGRRPRGQRGPGQRPGRLRLPG
jgi:hypothetical protein